MTTQIGHTTTLTGASTGLISQITNAAGPNQTVDPVDVTSFESADFCKEFIAGLIDSGEATFTVIYDGSAAGIADSLQAALLARTAEVWTFVYPDTSTNAALGFITALGIAVPNGDKITQDVTIKFTAAVTFTDVA